MGNLQSTQGHKTPRNFFFFSSTFCFSFFEAIIIVQELCESRGGHPGLSVLTSLLVSVDIKNY